MEHGQYQSTKKDVSNLSPCVLCAERRIVQRSDVVWEVVFFSTLGFVLLFRAQSNHFPTFLNRFHLMLRIVPHSLYTEYIRRKLHSAKNKDHVFGITDQREGVVLVVLVEFFGTRWFVLFQGRWTSMCGLGCLFLFAFAFAFAFGGVVKRWWFDVFRFEQG